MFVDNDTGFDGAIHRKILEALGGKDNGVFDLPTGADPLHKGHWVQHYPIVLCPSNIVTEERLYFTPFDCRGRDIFSRFINDANEVYLSTESFTDERFSKFLLNIATNKKIPIKILTEPSSMDFNDRINRMLRDLLSRDIDVRTTAENLHAKLLITDKALFVSSINLNKINLGFKITKDYWRENTETLLLITKPAIINQAKTAYLQVFSMAVSIQQKLVEKLQNEIKDLLKETCGLRTTKKVKECFGKVVLKGEIDLRKMSVTLGRVARILAEQDNAKILREKHFVSALVLYYLSENGNLKSSQLKEKLDDVDEGAFLESSTTFLQEIGLITREDDSFKLT